VSSLLPAATTFNPFIDLVFIAFQFWLLGVSVVAVRFTSRVSPSAVSNCVKILNESIPHIIASLFTHTVATGELTTRGRNRATLLILQPGWSAFQITHTNQFRASFSRSITTGACGVNLLPTYWGPRRSAETASLALNASALLIAVVLSWRLTKVRARLPLKSPF
jgi:hypothetical protein